VSDCFPGRRVFRFVLNGKQVELDQIHAEAVIEAKELRSAVFNMLAFGFLTVQVAPSSCVLPPETVK
jgi:hypothetical protein